MSRLPVSQAEVSVRAPTGVEDLLLLEAVRTSTELALALVARLVDVLARAPDAWDALPVPDLEALLLLLRRTVLGDRIRAETVCTMPTCGARIDVDFSINAYLAHHLPRTPRNVALDGSGEDAPAWYRLLGTQARFRLPVVADRLAVAYSANPVRDLARRCIQPANLAAVARRRAIQAMAALAPSLSHELDGRCPECGTALEFYLDVQEFTLRELRDQARYLLDDVHLIARTYHWTEGEILALPRARRMRYAERIRQELGQET